MIELRQVVSDLKSALEETFHPDWFNIMQLGNMAEHLHLQLVPRYKGKRKFEGRTFFDKDFGHMVIDRWNPEDKEFLIKVVQYLKKHI